MPEKGGSSLHVGRAQAPLSEYLHEDGAKDAQEYLILYGFGDGQGEWSGDFIEFTESSCGPGGWGGWGGVEGRKR